MTNRHEPSTRTLVMITEALLSAEKYPSRKELWRMLPRRVQYQTFKRALEYLEATNQIVFNGKSVVYTAVDNDKLRAFIESTVKAVKSSVSTRSASRIPYGSSGR